MSSFTWNLLSSADLEIESKPPSAVVAMKTELSSPTGTLDGPDFPAPWPAEAEEL